MNKLCIIYKIYKIYCPTFNLSFTKSKFMSKSKTFKKKHGGRAGHILTFFKSFHFVLERGPSARSFLFFNRSVLVLFCPVPSRRTVIPFCSVLGVLIVKERFHPSIVPFLVKNVSFPRFVLCKERFHPCSVLLKNPLF